MPGTAERGPVRFDPPEQWVTVAVDRPELQPGSDVGIDSWTAWGDPTSAGRAVAACLGRDLGTWTDEATSFAIDRLVWTMGATATKLTGKGSLRASPSVDVDHVATSSVVGVGDSEGVLSGRIFFGFTGPATAPHATGCFVLCAPATPACERSLAAATTSSLFVRPPAANIALRAVVAGVHHPRLVAFAALGALAVLGVVAIRMRPRPRTK